MSVLVIGKADVQEDLSLEEITNIPGETWQNFQGYFAGLLTKLSGDDRLATKWQKDMTDPNNKLDISVGVWGALSTYWGENNRDLQNPGFVIFDPNIVKHFSQSGLKAMIDASLKISPLNAVEQPFFLVKGYNTRIGQDNRIRIAVNLGADKVFYEALTGLKDTKGALQFALIKEYANFAINYLAETDPEALDKLVQQIVVGNYNYEVVCNLTSLDKETRQWAIQNLLKIHLTADLEEQMHPDRYPTGKRLARTDQQNMSAIDGQTAHSFIVDLMSAYEASQQKQIINAKLDNIRDAINAGTTKKEARKLLLIANRLYRQRSII
jgi:hypothetical protein